MNLNSFKKGNKEKIAVVGLGYVGLPLAVLLNEKYNVLGFDINEERIKELRSGIDRTREVDSERLKSCSIDFTSDPKKLSEAKVIIITVPTPIDKHKIPDLRPLKSATRTVGRYMPEGAIVVYESTVFPGATEEVCVPILEQESGLRWKEGFNVGYSPERVNPGDKEHTIDKIVKVVSGDTPEVTDFLAELYGSVIKAGIHKAPSIKTAEAAKVIENTQRDLNIALMNELSMIFNKMGIDTKAVLEAAGTKWNFLKFEPGLVGGHCIGVDPYYLTFKAQELGHHPEVILAGRRINDNMPKFVVENTVKSLIRAGKTVKGSKVLILGITFKENIPDIRNSKVIDLIRELESFGIETYVYDPYAYPVEVEEEYGISLLLDGGLEKYAPYDGAIVAVRHKQFLDFGFIERVVNMLSKESAVFIDIKSVYRGNFNFNKRILYWCL